jgi:hypothetical protein
MKGLNYIFPLLLAVSVNSLADESGIPGGTWLGSIKLPGKDKVATRVQVTKVNNNNNQDTTKITMYVDETPLDFLDLNIRKNTLHFTINTGTLKQCALKKLKDGAYTGFCEATDSSDKDERIELSMRPPQAEENSPTTPSGESSTQ